MSIVCLVRFVRDSCKSRVWSRLWRLELRTKGRKHMYTADRMCELLTAIQLHRARCRWHGAAMAHGVHAGCQIRWDRDCVGSSFPSTHCLFPRSSAPLQLYTLCVPSASRVSAVIPGLFDPLVHLRFQCRGIDPFDDFRLELRRLCIFPLMFKTLHEM